jgi:hypothetical protein
MTHKHISDFVAAGGGGPTEQPFVLSNPIIVMFLQDKKVTCHIHKPPDYTYEHYGLLICDLVRHVAHAFKVDEDDVWEWVDKERSHPTTDLTEAS